jgi:hypothetical protein
MQGNGSANGRRAIDLYASDKSCKMPSKLINRPPVVTDAYAAVPQIVPLIQEIEPAKMAAAKWRRAT